MTTTLVWFRRDLRLADNAALTAALRGADAVVPVFVHPSVVGPHAGGPGAEAWLDRSLASLDDSLRERGSGLVIRVGAPAAALAQLAEECGASRVHCQRDHSPDGMAEEAAVREVLRALGVTLEVAEGQLLVTPEQICTGSGGPYRVFTPYWKSWARAWEPAQPLAAPDAIPRPTLQPPSAGPVAARPGAPDIVRWWTPGERGAHAALKRFVDEALADYAEQRDRPDLRGTSELSPRLACGELSPRQVMWTLRDATGTEAFVRQLAWREFSHHLAHHFPHMLDAPLRAEFSAFPWCDAGEAFDAWKQGCTGYPLVDAGMRQLAATGWMHNRVRLVCASMLTKHLLVDWRAGQAHFRDRLADHDAAVNAFNWQWVAGSGADAAPYFRIFNPRLQGERFDPHGDYVRTWVPELGELDTRWIHHPHDAPAWDLARAGVRLGETYPLPLIDHREARERALAAYAATVRRA